LTIHPPHTHRERAVRALPAAHSVLELHDCIPLRGGSVPPLPPAERGVRVTLLLLGLTVRAEFVRVPKNCHGRVPIRCRETEWEQLAIVVGHYCFSFMEKHLPSN